MADRPALLRPQARPAPAEAAERLRPPARPAHFGEGPVEVADGATLEGALPLDRTALLGLLSGPAGRAALLRLRDGAVVRAAQGDAVAGGVVTAIDDAGVRFWQDGEETLLTMPA